MVSIIDCGSIDPCSIHGSPKFSFLQSKIDLNEWKPIFWTIYGILMLSIDEHTQNALYEISLTLSGIVTLESDEQF